MAFPQLRQKDGKNTTYFLIIKCLELLKNEREIKAETEKSGKFNMCTSKELIIFKSMGSTHYITTLLLSIAGIIIMISITLYYYPLLPEDVPIHFSATGNPDNYGSKNIYWFLIMVATTLVAFLSYMSKNAHKHKDLIQLPSKLKDKPELREKAVVLVKKQMSVLSVVLAWVFVYLQYGGIQVALGNWNDLGDYLVIIILGVILLPVAYFTYRSYRLS